MTTIVIPKQELKSIIKESVREVIIQELMQFRALFLPYVSQREQKDIEKSHGKPSRNIAKTIKITL